MGAKTKNQIVLKKQKCGSFLFKIFEPKMSIRSNNVALAGNRNMYAPMSNELNTNDLCYLFLNA